MNHSTKPLPLEVSRNGRSLCRPLR
jgi:hypothetical protein